MDNKKYEPWFSWAQELQFLVQAGLAYTTNVFDKERFERIREISADGLSHNSLDVCLSCTLRKHYGQGDA